MHLFSKPTTMVAPDEALPGRDEAMRVTGVHEVLGNPIAPPFPASVEVVQAFRPAVILGYALSR